jgi:hypothetical protein
MPNVKIYLFEKQNFAHKYKFILDLYFFELSPINSKFKVCYSQAVIMIRSFYLAYIKSFFDKKHIIRNQSSNKELLGLFNKFENHICFTEKENRKWKELLNKAYFLEV